MSALSTLSLITGSLYGTIQRMISLGHVRSRTVYVSKMYFHKVSLIVVRSFVSGTVFCLYFFPSLLW
jgi:hypothetical protein